ncbi:MAG: hypothetical protein P1V35_13510 [Planctomycetota bacterium]|nr:hypothetical protein [Planctomycetota bacterium]
MPQHNVARLALVLFTLLLTACGDDGENENARKHFAAGANRQRGIEVLHPTQPELPYYHSFGNVAYGKRYMHTFEMRNIEDTAITILRAEPACACSRVTAIQAWNGDTKDQGVLDGDLSQRDNVLRVEPGQKFSIDFLIDTERVHANAGKLAVVRVYTDSKIEPYLTFELNFFPEKLFELADSTLKLGDIPLGGGVADTMQIHAQAALNQARLVDVHSTSEGLEAELVLIEGRDTIWNLHVTAVDQIKRGPFQGKVILSTTDGLGQGDSGRLEIAVEGRVVPAVMMYPPNLSFGRLDQGKGRALHAAVQGLAPGHRIQISDARLEGPSAPHLTVELEAIAEDTFGRSARIDVHVRCKESAPAGPIDATLTLDLVDEAEPTIIRQIHGVVE